MIKCPAPCKVCNDLAVWKDLSLKADPGYFCDEHVPRDCNCTMRSFDYTAALGHPDRDILVMGLVAFNDKRRPCTIYEYVPNGFLEEETNVG